jgi:glycosyltransferase involved in cell wall biosynthesis
MDTIMAPASWVPGSIATRFPPKSICRLHSCCTFRQPPAGKSSRATVLFVGRLQSRKRLDLLLKACSDLPEALKPNLVIIGDGPARVEYEDLAVRVYPQTQFLGALHGTEVEPYLLKADLFVLPGTGGLAIQQAMSFALPIIVARGDGTQDDLVRPENGWQIPPDNLQALIDALSMALSDLTRLRQMGLASHRIVAEEINIDRMVEVFLQAIAETAA